MQDPAGANAPAVRAPGPAGAGARPAQPALERLAPLEGETILVVKEAHVVPILDGTKTLLLRPWKLRNVGRWFLATRECVHGKVSLGEPLAIRDATMWAAREAQHMEGAAMRYRPGYCWAHPISHPLRLEPLPFQWTAGALLMCKYRSGAVPPLNGAADDPIENSDEAAASRPNREEPAGAPARKRRGISLLVWAVRLPTVIAICFPVQEGQDGLGSGEGQRRPCRAVTAKQLPQRSGESRPKGQCCSNSNERGESLDSSDARESLRDISSPDRSCHPRRDGYRRRTIRDRTCILARSP